MRVGRSEVCCVQAKGRRREAHLNPLGLLFLLERMHAFHEIRRVLVWVVEDGDALRYEPRGVDIGGCFSLG